MTSIQPTTALDETQWWRRPAGGREVLQVALPLVVSMLSVTVMTFVDRMFLNWSSSVAMSAAFVGSIVWWAVVCLPMGLCTYVNTFVSQYHGDGQPDRIGPVMWQGVWIALLFTPLFLLAMPLAPAMFGIAGHSELMTQQEVGYFQILCVGSPAMLVAQALSAFYGGRGLTWVAMVVDTIVVVINVVLDYWWIFGKAGFPVMGVDGAAWATVVALWLKAAIYLLLVLQKKHRSEFRTLAGMRVDGPLTGRLLYYGLPSGVQMLLDVLGWTVFVIVVSRLGETESTATTLAFSISSMAFMPIWGFGLATSILVGQHLGEDRDDLAARATWTSLWIALGYMTVMSVLYVFVPDWFLDPFFTKGDIPPDAKEVIRGMATTLLLIVAAYNFMDAVLMIFVNALKGAGDTQFVLYVSVVMAILLASLSWLAVEAWHLSIYACWMIAVGWICGMAVTFFWRFQTGQWRLMRVIESQHPVTLNREQDATTATRAESTTATASAD